MTNQPRRRFLATSAGLVSGLALQNCETNNLNDSERQPSAELDRDTLTALSHLVLPKNTLGEEGITRTLNDFLRWLSQFEPVAELNHSYLSTDEITYGGPDPAPQWSAQLQALEIEASKSYSKRFSDIGAEKQRVILDHQLPNTATLDLPYTGDAPHIAIGLLSFFYSTSEANDLAYDAAIERHTCRGLDSAPNKPTPLTKGRG